MDLIITVKMLSYSALLPQINLNFKKVCVSVHVQPSAEGKYLWLKILMRVSTYTTSRYSISASLGYFRITLQGVEDLMQ